MGSQIVINSTRTKARHFQHELSLELPRAQRAIKIEPVSFAMLIDGDRSRAGLLWRNVDTTGLVCVFWQMVSCETTRPELSAGSLDRWNEYNLSRLETLLAGRANRRYC
jgi:hypothetical protein